MPLSYTFKHENAWDEHTIDMSDINNLGIHLA